MTSKHNGHLVLIVEDDEAIGNWLCEIVRARGDRPMLATNVEQAFALLEQERFCYCLLDQHLPLRPGAPPVISAGETLLRHARKQDPRRNDDGYHVFPLVVVSGWSRDPSFVSAMHRMGASGFVDKAATATLETNVSQAIQQALADASRTDHAGCAEFAPTRARGAPPLSKPVSVRVDGERYNRSNVVYVNGERQLVTDAVFQRFVRLLAAFVLDRHGWLTRTELHVPENTALLSRVRDIFANVVGGRRVVESGRSRRFRLRGLVVEHVDWAQLERSDDAIVARSARSAMGKRTG